jgi:hypothetical protein
MRQKAINSIKFSVNVEDDSKKSKKTQKEDVCLTLWLVLRPRLRLKLRPRLRLVCLLMLGIT